MKYTLITDRKLSEIEIKKIKNIVQDDLVDLMDPDYLEQLHKGNEKKETKQQKLLTYSEIRKRQRKILSEADPTVAKLLKIGGTLIEDDEGDFIIKFTYAKSPTVGKSNMGWVDHYDVKSKQLIFRSNMPTTEHKLALREEIKRKLL